MLRSKRGKEIRTCLDEHIKAGRVRIAVDPSEGIIGEWLTTCNAEAVKVTIAKWQSYNGGLYAVSKLGRFTTKQRKFLLVQGFNDAVDKLLLKTALATNHRVVVSDDPDFWDPKNRKNKGKCNALVAHFCTKELQIRLLLLGMLMELLQIPLVPR